MIGQGPADARSADHRRRNPDAGGRSPSVERILERVSREVGSDGFSRYFRHQTRVRYVDGRLDVTVPTGFVAELIGKRFGPSLVRAAQEEMGTEPAVELRFNVDRTAFDASGDAAVTDEAAAIAPPPPPRRAPARREPGRDPGRYLLEDFVVGDSNRLAFTAAERLAEPDCPRSFSPLFIHGACGLGKTHLLQGVAHRFRERHPGLNVVYTTAEAFTNDYVNAVRAGRLDVFRKTYRAIRLLCIDDVQFLSNKHATQGELLHTFDAIDLGGARIVLASDEHPRQVRKLSAALVSRFMAGMVVKLDAPDPALRQRIVARLAERRGLTVEPAAAALIAARCSPPGQSCSVRDIEGAITRIQAVRRLHPEFAAGSDIGLVVTRLALCAGESPCTTGLRRPVRAEQIIDEVCRTLRVEHSDLVGRGRHKRVVLARSVAAHLCRGMTTMSFPEIARAMGRPNHSTIVTACKRIQDQLEDASALDLGADSVPELAGLNLRGLIDQVRDDIARSVPGA